jgi:hypothetical protein
MRVSLQRLSLTGSTLLWFSCLFVPIGATSNSTTPLSGPTTPAPPYSLEDVATVPSSALPSNAPRSPLANSDVWDETARSTTSASGHGVQIVFHQSDGRTGIQKPRKRMTPEQKLVNAYRRKHGIKRTCDHARRNKVCTCGVPPNELEQMMQSLTAKPVGSIFNPTGTNSSAAIQVFGYDDSDDPVPSLTGSYSGFPPSPNSSQPIFDDGSAFNEVPSFTESSGSGEKYVRPTVEDPNERIVNRILLQPETRPITQEQLINEARGIYAGLVMVEKECVEINTRQFRNPDQNLSNEQWQPYFHQEFFRDQIVDSDEEMLGIPSMPEASAGNSDALKSRFASLFREDSCTNDAPSDFAFFRELMGDSSLGEMTQDTGMPDFNFDDFLVPESSNTPSGSIQAHRYLSSVMDVDLLKERLMDLEAEYAHVTGERELRKKIGLDLGDESNAFLDNFEIERAQRVTDLEEAGSKMAEYEADLDDHDRTDYYTNPFADEDLQGEGLSGAHVPFGNGLLSDTFNPEMIFSTDVDQPTSGPSWQEDYPLPEMDWEFDLDVLIVHDVIQSIPVIVLEQKPQLALRAKSAGDDNADGNTVEHALHIKRKCDGQAINDREHSSDESGWVKLPEKDNEPGQNSSKQPDQDSQHVSTQVEVYQAIAVDHALLGGTRARPEGIFLLLLMYSQRSSLNGAKRVHGSGSVGFVAQIVLLVLAQLLCGMKICSL